MKKFTILLLLFALISYSNLICAQTTHPTEFGINVGTSWLQSDVKMRKIGSGGGFTLGKMYLENATNPIDIGWRLRWLHAVAYGQDLQKSTGIANNTTFNGTMNPILNYNDSVGFVYQNHKTDIYEMSLEFVIGANSIREQTHFYPYLFGGIGLVKTITYTNQLNSLGQRYDYMKVDSIGKGDKAVVQSQLNSIYDGSYETTAQGSEHPEWKIMPSLGIGIGYQVSKLFSIGLEHKITWTLNDVVDGQQWKNNNTLTGTNDIYHYTSAWIKFSFGRTPPRPHPPVNNTVQTTPNTVTQPKPIVVITSPTVHPYTSPQKNITVVAKISHIYSRSDISFTVNGVTNTGFAYDNASQTFSFPATLLNGTNTFVISAATDMGGDSKSTEIIYRDPNAPASPSPVVTITHPAPNPFTTAQESLTVNATIQHVTSKNQIQLLFNNVQNTTFTYNELAKTIVFNCNLTSGTNSIKIIANNGFGVDSKTETVIYQKPVVVQKPVVTIITPSDNPHTTSSERITIEATVLNVTSSNEISVKLNGIANNSFTFNPSTKVVMLNANLVLGNNSVLISATNQGGSDSKTTTVIYKVAVQKETNSVVSKDTKGAGTGRGESVGTISGTGLGNASNKTPAPVVTFINPANTPSNSSSVSYNITATVLNVAGSSNISVKLNGATITNFNYDFQSKKVSFNANLIRGTNTVIISGTNTTGTDSKTATINFIGS
jgi:hypothetical protein